MIEKPAVDAAMVAALLVAVRDALWRGADPLEVAALVDSALEKLEEAALNGP